MLHRLGVVVTLVSYIVSSHELIASASNMHQGQNPIPKDLCQNVHLVWFGSVWLCLARTLGIDPFCQLVIAEMLNVQSPGTKDQAQTKAQQRLSTGINSKKTSNFGKENSKRRRVVSIVIYH